MKRYGPVYVDLFFLALFTFLLVIGYSYDYEARLLPMVITIPGLIFIATQLFRDLMEIKRRKTLIPGPNGPAGQSGDVQSVEVDSKKVPMANQIKAMLWVASFFAVVLLLGFHISIVVFVLVFTRTYSRRSWLSCFAMTAACWTSVYLIFNLALEVVLFNGFLVEYIKDVLYY